MSLWGIWVFVYRLFFPPVFTADKFFLEERRRVHELVETGKDDDRSQELILEFARSAVEDINARRLEGLDRLNELFKGATILAGGIVAAVNALKLPMTGWVAASLTFFLLAMITATLGRRSIIRGSLPLVRDAMESMPIHHAPRLWYAATLHKYVVANEAVVSWMGEINLVVTTEVVIGIALLFSLIF